MCKINLVKTNQTSENTKKDNGREVVKGINTFKR